MGTIYHSIDGTNPSEFMGGTWEPWSEGRVPVGMGSNGTTNYTTVNARFGVDSVTLTTGQLPAHVHSMAHTHNIPNHVHTMAHTHGMAHTHTNSINHWEWTTPSGQTATERLGTWSGTTLIGNVYATSAGAMTTQQMRRRATPPATGASSAANTGGSSDANTGNPTTLPATGGVSTANTGNNTGAVGGSHENRMPCTTCYMWLRTA